MAKLKATMVMTALLALVAVGCEDDANDTTDNPDPGVLDSGMDPDPGVGDAGGDAQDTEGDGGDEDGDASADGG